MENNCSIFSIFINYFLNLTSDKPNFLYTPYNSSEIWILQAKLPRQKCNQMLGARITAVINREYSCSKLSQKYRRAKTKFDKPSDKE